MEEGHPRRLQELAGPVEPGAAEGDVIGLPFPGRARGVEEGGILAIDRPRLTVGVGVGLVGIQHLDLELTHQEDAAVAAVLALAVGRIGAAHSTWSWMSPYFPFVSIGPAPGAVSM